MSGVPSQIKHKPVFLVLCYPSSSRIFSEKKDRKGSNNQTQINADKRRCFCTSLKVPGNAWYFPRVRYRMEEYENHPSQKPESLLERIILASSHEGSLILDPFAGTFTTAAVAKRLNRKSISIELQEEYLKIGLRRVLGMEEYQEEKLLPEQKNHTVKNKNGRKVDLDFIQGSIFDETTTA